MNTTIDVIIVIILLSISFVPYIVSDHRRHNNNIPILCLNTISVIIFAMNELTTGSMVLWRLVGENTFDVGLICYIVALVWAFTNDVDGLKR